MIRRACPSCFELCVPFHLPSRCANSEDRCEDETDATLAHAWGIDEPIGHVIPAAWRWRVAGEVPCDRCHFPSITRLCPHCHMELPSDFGDFDDQVIAVLGPADAGKSHYIAVLLKRLSELAGKHGFAIWPATDRTLARYARDFDRHLRGRRVIPATASAAATTSPTRLPLIYTLAPSTAGSNARRTRLVFFDIAGEDTRSTDRLNLVARYLRHARGLLVLVDPTTLPGVRSRLSEASDRHEGSHAAWSLQPYEAMVRAGPNGRAGKLRVPLAVVLTKCDQVEHLFDPWSAVRQYPVAVGPVARAQRDAIDAEVRSQLAVWDAGDLVSTADAAFHHTRFFAVSALGAPPRGSELAHQPLPRRIEDPLLWILEHIGVLPLPEEGV